MGKLGEALDGVEYAPPDPRRNSSRILRLDPFDDAKEIGVGWFRPTDRRHEWGGTIRSNAATTVAWSTTRPSRSACFPSSTAARNCCSFATKLRRASLTSQDLERPVVVARRFSSASRSASTRAAMVTDFDITPSCCSTMFTLYT